jgi:hypothetical protein
MILSGDFFGSIFLVPGNDIIIPMKWLSVSKYGYPQPARILEDDTYARSAPLWRKN